jgi:hypothetical protein
MLLGGNRHRHAKFTAEIDVVIVNVPLPDDHVISSKPQCQLVALASFDILYGLGPHAALLRPLHLSAAAWLAGWLALPQKEPPGSSP